MSAEQTSVSGPDPKKYWAFISYSSKDRKQAQWLRRRLENYPIPADFHGTELRDGSRLGKHLRPIFRDRDELSGSAELGPKIHTALKDSRFLVVLCSRNSAQSQWVNKEIEDFREMGGEQRILALILDGEPNATANPEVADSEECFPPALRLPLEPLAGDLRKEADGKERGFLKVLAGISEIGFDDLYRRHERARRRRRLILASAAGLIVSIFIYLLTEAHLQRQLSALREQEARNNRSWSQFHQGQNASEQRHNLEAIAYYGAALETAPEQYEIGIKALYALANTSSFLRAEGSPDTVEIASSGQQVAEDKVYSIQFSPLSNPEAVTKVYGVAQKRFLRITPEDQPNENLGPASYYSINSFAAGSNSYFSTVVVGFGINSEFGSEGGVIIADSSGPPITIDLEDFIHSVHLSSDANHLIASSETRLFYFQRSAHPASAFAQVWSLALEDVLATTETGQLRVAGFDSNGDLVFDLLNSGTEETETQVVARRIGNALYPERIPLNPVPFSAPNHIWDADSEALLMVGLEPSVGKQPELPPSDRFSVNSGSSPLSPDDRLEIYSSPERQLLWTFAPPNNLQARGSLLNRDTHLLIDIADGGSGLNGFWLYNPRLGFPYQDWLNASGGPFSWSEKEGRVFSFSGRFRDQPEFIQAIDLLGEDSPPPSWLPQLCYAVSGLQPDATGRLIPVPEQERRELLGTVKEQLEHSPPRSRWSQFGKWYLRGQFPESGTVSPNSTTRQSEYQNPARYNTALQTFDIPEEAE